jgi:hypothetical protein
MLPPTTDPRWRDIVTGKADYEFEFLALKVLLGRLRVTLTTDGSPAALDGCVKQLRNLLEETADLPKASRDIARMFGGER